jgi:hypothetical protein
LCSSPRLGKNLPFPKPVRGSMCRDLPTPSNLGPCFTTAWRLESSRWSKKGLTCDSKH